jgi:hypothetical protein
MMDAGHLQETIMARPRLHRLTLVSALALALLPGTAWAPPKGIGLRAMVDGCEVIAVARFADERKPAKQGVTVELEFTKVLKGMLKPGTYRVAYTDRPRVGDDAPEFVAFFGKGLCWRFVARPISTVNRVADGVLRVEGFNDSNGYFVSPGLVTLAQIEGLLKHRGLSYTFRGPLYFPQRGKAAWAPSKLQVEVRYDAAADRAEVRGLPALQGFPSRPAVAVGEIIRNTDVSLTYSRDIRAPLLILGQVQSAELDGGGMRAKFFVAEPVLPTRAAFEAYVADPQKGHAYYTVQLACAPFGGEKKPRVLTLTQGSKTGRLCELSDWSQQPLKVVNVGEDDDAVVARADLESGGQVSLEFDLGKAEADAFRWTFQDTLLYRLLVGDVTGKVMLGEGGAERQVTTFTASLGEVRHAQLKLPRTEMSGLAGSDPNPALDRKGGEDFECQAPGVTGPVAEEGPASPGKGPATWSGLGTVLLLVYAVGGAATGLIYLVGFLLTVLHHAKTSGVLFDLWRHCTRLIFVMPLWPLVAAGLLVEFLRRPPASGGGIRGQEGPSIT